MIAPTIIGFYVAFNALYLQIEVDKGLQTVTMTPLMKFVVRMVQVLKQQAPITMYDLKQTLNVSLGTCFEFGKHHWLFAHWNFLRETITLHIPCNQIYDLIIYLFATIVFTITFPLDYRLSKLVISHQRLC